MFTYAVIGQALFLFLNGLIGSVGSYTKTAWLVHLVSLDISTIFSPALSFKSVLNQFDVKRGSNYVSVWFRQTAVSFQVLFSFDTSTGLIFNHRLWGCLADFITPIENCSSIKFGSLAFNYLSWLNLTTIGTIFILIDFLTNSADLPNFQMIPNRSFESLIIKFNRIIITWTITVSISLIQRYIQSRFNQ